MLRLDANHAVCVGGRWDGWLFHKHPDGRWVSLQKLDDVEYPGEGVGTVSGFLEGEYSGDTNGRN
jgi:hypothetical protein